jgi:hypothetical protein
VLRPHPRGWRWEQIRHARVLCDLRERRQVALGDRHADRLRRRLRNGTYQVVRQPKARCSSALGSTTVAGVTPPKWSLVVFGLAACTGVDCSNVDCGAAGVDVDTSHYLAAHPELRASKLSACILGDTMQCARPTALLRDAPGRAFIPAPVRTPVKVVVTYKGASGSLVRLVSPSVKVGVDGCCTTRPRLTLNEHGDWS